MANEIQFDGGTGLSGETLYVLIRDSVGRVWSTVGAAFETYQTANILNYEVYLYEQGSASGYFAGNFPSAIGAGIYTLTVKQCAAPGTGTGATEADESVGGGEIYWDGSQVYYTGGHARYKNVSVTPGVGGGTAVSVTVEDDSSYCLNMVGNGAEGDIVRLTSAQDGIPLRLTSADGNGLRITGASQAVSIISTGAIGLSVTGNTYGIWAFGNTADIGGDITGSLSGSVGSVTGNVGGNVVGSVASVAGNVGGNVAGSVASVTGNVGGSVAGSVASVTGTVGGIAGTITTLDALATYGDAGWATATGFLTSAQLTSAFTEIKGSGWSATTDTLEKIRDAITASNDPLVNTVPGDYDSGTAGWALGRIGTGRITTTSIVSQGGDITIVQGDTYTHGRGRAISWTDVDSGWPDLTEATVFFEISDGLLSKQGTVVTASGSGKQVRVDLLASETETLGAGVYDYSVVVTFVGTGTDAEERVTLVQGKCTVTDSEES